MCHPSLGISHQRLSRVDPLTDPLTVQNGIEFICGRGLERRQGV
jgi:hypothetical protein